MRNASDPDPAVMAQRWKVPGLARSFDGASHQDVSWVLNGYAIAFAALLVPAAAVPSTPRRTR